MKDKELGTFTISLDFELMWGVIDINKDAFADNVKGVYNALPRLLQLFEQYGVHATIAPVGLIYCANNIECLKYIPKKKPSYNNEKISPYINNFLDTYTAEHHKMFYAPELIELLKQYDNIEIGSHTFCHYYCWEKGQTVEQFEDDLKAAVNISNDNGVNVKSIIFPRNNVSDKYLDVCKKYGITSYRGNPPKYYDEIHSFLPNMKQRVLRLLDNYVNVGGSNIPSYDSLKHNGMVNVCASRFLRPYSPKLAFADGMRLRRIKGEMKSAAMNHRLYHLWWHPMNIGINTEKNLSFIEDILKYYLSLNNKYGMTSKTMNELATLLK